MPVLREAGVRGFVRNLRLDQEAVPFARNGLDVKRLVRGVAQRLAELVDGGIDVGIVVDMRIGGPQARTQLFAGDDFARFF